MMVSPRAVGTTAGKASAAPRNAVLSCQGFDGAVRSFWLWG